MGAVSNSIEVFLVVDLHQIIQLLNVVTIATTGNAQDFGNLTGGVGNKTMAGCSMVTVVSHKYA